MKFVFTAYFCLLLGSGIEAVIINNLSDYCTKKSYCWHECEGLYYGDFKEVTINVSTKFDCDGITFKNSNFYTIPKNILQISNTVTSLSLYMTNCSLKEIHKWNFYSGQPNVRISGLRLTENQIERIPSEVFEFLPNLPILDLSSNKLSVLEVDCFKGLKKLYQLWLYENHIQTLREDIFDELTELEMISLSDNRLQFLPENVFKNNKKLWSISLRNNRLKFIDANIVKSRTALQIILTNFDESIQITPISTFSIASVEYMDITGNFLPYISNTSLRKMTKLRQFRASSVNLTCIEDGAFSHMPFLQFLFLSNNRLANFDLNLVANATSLKQLLLDGNRLKELDYNLLMDPPKPDLSYVSLGENVFSCDHSRDLRLYLEKIKVESDLTEQSCERRSVKTKGIGARIKIHIRKTN